LLSDPKLKAQSEAFKVALQSPKPDIKSLASSGFELRKLGYLGDERLFGNKCYTNANGNELRIFDKFGNHSFIEAQISQNKIEKIILPN
jgi:hypothetical protein